MKYISRLTALLLAMGLLLCSAASALTLDDLTEDQLAGLYQSAAATATVTTRTDVLGWKTALSVENGESLAAAGTTFQWYEIVGEEKTEITGATAYSLDVTYTLEEKQYQCFFTDVQGNAYQSDVFSVVAQTDNLDDYLNALYSEYEERYYIPCVPLDAYIEAAYTWMQTWNVALADGTNLAENVHAYWQADPYPAELLCSCADENAAFCINGPDAEHPKTCGWYTGTPVLKLEEDIDENGNTSYTLYITVNAEDVVLAVSEMLDGQHHYFRDVREGELGLYVAWLYIDDEGTPWLMPLESEREIPVE